MRLEDIAVVAVRLAEDAFERMHLGQVRNRRPGVGIGKPQPVGHAKAGMAVQRQAERAVEQLGLHHLAQGLTLGLHGRQGHAAKPGQARTDALAAHQKRHGLQGRHRRVAHQVHAARVGAGAHLHATRVDEGHKHQTHGFELLVQAAVPLQAHHQAVQIGDHHLGPNALQPVHAAEVAHGGHGRVRVTQGDDLHRIAAAGHGHLADHAALQMGRTEFDDAVECGEFG